jgi:hypothetical protein
VTRGLARATYKVREELAACRSPLISGAEYPRNYQASAPNIAKDTRAAANALGNVYNERWKHVTAALHEFDAQCRRYRAAIGTASHSFFPMRGRVSKRPRAVSSPGKGIRTEACIEYLNRARTLINEATKSS